MLFHIDFGFLQIDTTWLWLLIFHVNATYYTSKTCSPSLSISPASKTCSVTSIIGITHIRRSISFTLVGFQAWMWNLPYFSNDYRGWMRRIGQRVVFTRKVGRISANFIGTGRFMITPALWSNWYAISSNTIWSTF